MGNHVTIVAINVSERWAVTKEGLCLHISDMFDEFGVETNNPDLAVAGVAEAACGWVTIDFEEFEDVDAYH